MTREQRVFNYRLSRARRTVENAFGILANRFRVFITPIALSPEKVETITLAGCVLHNYHRTQYTSRHVCTPPGSMDSEDPLNTSAKFGRMAKNYSKQWVHISKQTRE